MIYGLRRMIYLLRKHDIISVPSYAAGIYHPPQVDIISKIYHPFSEERISLKNDKFLSKLVVFHGRSGETRTRGLCVPNAALYQTEPHLVIFNFILSHRPWFLLRSPLAVPKIVFTRRSTLPILTATPKKSSFFVHRTRSIFLPCVPKPSENIFYNGFWRFIRVFSRLKYHLWASFLHCFHLLHFALWDEMWS